NRASQQDSSGERLEIVVGESRQRLDVEDHRRLVAIPCDDLDDFAVAHRGAFLKEERAGGAVGPDLADDLARARVARPNGASEAIVFKVPEHAVEAPVVVAE